MPIDAIYNLKRILDRLRGPNGCPWDREQTSRSLKPYLLEEAHEVAEAIETGDPTALREELGDLLMNIFLQARIGEEEGTFTLEDVADGISEKLIRRHPHVFGDAVADSSETVRRKWEEIKRQEKASAPSEGVLRELPASLPALATAQRLGEMAAEYGFDWPDHEGPAAKVEEETAEVRAALRGGDPVAVEHEIGDLLFAISSLCRHVGVDAESALRNSLKRFRTRFRHIERTLGPDSDASVEQMEALWQEAKQRERPDA